MEMCTNFTCPTPPYLTHDLTKLSTRPDFLIWHPHCGHPFATRPRFEHAVPLDDHPANTASSGARYGPPPSGTALACGRTGWRILSRTHLPVGTPAPPSGSLERAVSAYSACLHMLNRRPKKCRSVQGVVSFGEFDLQQGNQHRAGLNPDSADCIWSDCLFGI